MELEKMGKTELRAECKGAGVKNYGTLTVAAMRAALTALQPTAVMETVFTGPGKPPREERNGVKRPLKGACADVWSALDELCAKGETDLTTAIHAIGEKRKWNRNNIACELSAWRRFHGLSKLRQG